MDKKLAIRTIEEIYNQIDTTPGSEEQAKEFMAIFKKHHKKEYDTPWLMMKAMKRFADEKVIDLATDLGHLFSVEAYVYVLQAEYICNAFGQEAMGKANYGSGMGDGCVETKVYGIGILATRFNDEATNPNEVNAQHDFEPFHKEEEE